MLNTNPRPLTISRVWRILGAFLAQQDLESETLNPKQDLESETLNPKPYTLNQVCVCKPGGRADWYHPIDVHYTTTSMVGWPRLVLEIWSQVNPKLKSSNLDPKPNMVAGKP